MKTIEQRAEKPVLDLLDDVFGGWSLIGRESEKMSSMDWVSVDKSIIQSITNSLTYTHLKFIIIVRIIPQTKVNWHQSIQKIDFKIQVNCYAWAV